MKLNQTLAHIHRASARLSDRQGRVARRNARRKFLTALNAAKAAVDREYPLGRRPRPDYIAQAASSLDWHCFQRDVVKNISRRWDKELAQEFVTFVSTRLLFDRKAVLLDLNSHCRWQYGRLAQPPARYQDWDRDRWLSLLHELAHCRRSGHRRGFVRELAAIYRLWLEFLADYRRRNREEAAGQRRPGEPESLPLDAMPQRSELERARGHLIAACQSPVTDLLTVLRQRAQQLRSGRPTV